MKMGNKLYDYVRSALDQANSDRLIQERQQASEAIPPQSSPDNELAATSGDAAAIAEAENK